MKRLTESEIHYALSSQSYGWNQRAVDAIEGHIADLQQRLDEAVATLDDKALRFTNARLEAAMAVVEAARLGPCRHERYDCALCVAIEAFDKIEKEEG